MSEVAARAEGAETVPGARVRAARPRAIDARVVLLQIALTAFCAFYVNDPAASLAVVAFTMCTLAYLGCGKQALWLAAAAVAVNAACELVLVLPGLGAANVFLAVLFVLRKTVPLAGVALLFLHGLTVSRLVASLTAWRVPKPLVLTLAIAYRFMPTIGYEVGMIKDALKLRGRPLSVGSFLRAPRETCECVLVPLMMRCVRVADELSASATARAVENPVRRTSRVALRMRPADWGCLAFAVLSAACVIAIDRL